MTKILVIDDETDICFLISEILIDEKYICSTANNSNSALLKYDEFYPDLIILDVWLSESQFDGIELLNKFKELNPLIPIIIISGHGNVDMAVNAIKAGAYDFIEKPFNSEKLVITCKRALESAKLIKQNNHLKLISNLNISFVGNSIFSKFFIAEAVKIGQSNSRVLISGPDGAGKKLISQIIHQNTKFHESLPIIINIKNISEDDFKVLFSDDKKNINENIFVKSNNNTLILENIDFLKIEHQKKLLHMLENKNFLKISEIQSEIKIISTSSKDLKKEIENDNFLQSLYDRLSLIYLEVPPIKHRREDILPICNYYLDYYNKNKENKFIFSKHVQAKLELYDWPGNVSQIINYVEKIIILNQQLNLSNDYEINNLPLDMGDYTNIAKDEINFELSLREARYNFEKEYLLSQIKRFNGNIKKISDFTGMERTALYRKFKSLNIEIDKN